MESGECIDIDECSNDLCPSFGVFSLNSKIFQSPTKHLSKSDSISCENSPGSYKCQCAPGFEHLENAIYRRVGNIWTIKGSRVVRIFPTLSEYFLSEFFQPPCTAFINKKVAVLISTNVQLKPIVAQTLNQAGYLTGRRRL